MDAPPPLPLAGVKVVEIAQNLAGPFACMILSRLGADVVKVERPEGGDDARGWGPPFLAGAAAGFHAVNAGKRSITVDLKDAAAVAWLKDYLAEADVLVQNLRPGVVEELGLGPEPLRAANPRLVYCAISAFGRTGPLASRPGYEPMMQAFSGLMLMSGREGDPPFRVGLPVVDFGTGMWAAIGVLAALAQRQATGQGCVVDASLFETALAWMGIAFASFQLTGEMPHRHPTGSVRLVPFEAFETQDGPLVVAAGNDRLFAALAACLGRPEWATDPSYRTNALRVAHKEVLLADIGSILRTRTKAEWASRLEAAGVPCAPVHTLPEVLAQPQTAATGMMQPIPGLDLALMGLPVSFDGQRPPTAGTTPAVGQHNREILGPGPKRG